MLLPSLPLTVGLFFLSTLSYTTLPIEITGDEVLFNVCIHRPVSFTYKWVEYLFCKDHPNVPLGMESRQVPLPLTLSLTLDTREVREQRVTSSKSETPQLKDFKIDVGDGGTSESPSVSGTRDYTVRLVQTFPSLSNRTYPMTVSYLLPLSPRWRFCVFQK